MNHKPFTLISVISFLIIGTSCILYTYYTYMYPDALHLRFSLKPIPVTTMVVNVLLYFFIYKLHFYALFIELALLFCLLGDIALMFYLPEITDIPIYNNELVLILGGISFFIARCILCVNYIIYPFQTVTNKHLVLTRNKVFIAIAISSVYLLTSILFFSFKMKNGVMNVLLSIYLTIMSIQLSVSIIRIKGYPVETLSSQIIGCLGTVLFTISDTILFLNIFVVPIYAGSEVSITLYWLGLYLLTISVVRTKNEHIESNQNFFN